MNEYIFTTKHTVLIEADSEEEATEIYENLSKIDENRRNSKICLIDFVFLLDLLPFVTHLLSPPLGPLELVSSSLSVLPRPNPSPHLLPPRALCYSGFFHSISSSCIPSRRFLASPRPPSWAWRRGIRCAKLGSCWQSLEGSFSAVSTSLIARVGAFFSIF